MYIQPVLWLCWVLKYTFHKKMFFKKTSETLKQQVAEGRGDRIGHSRVLG